MGFLKHQPVLLGLSCPQVMVSSSASDIAMLSSELGQEMLLGPYRKTAPHGVFVDSKEYHVKPKNGQKKQTHTHGLQEEKCVFLVCVFLWIFLFNVYSGKKKTQRSLWHKLFTRRCSTMNSWKHGMNVVCLWRTSMLPCQQYVGPRVDFYMSRSAIFVAGGSWLRRRFSKISGW